MQLSKRLAAVANMVEQDACLADVGTDHAYLPIYLLENKRIQKALAADVRQGPLSRARAHIAQHGLEAYIETRCGDGLSILSPGECTAVVIAGMGGKLMVNILQGGRSILIGEADIPQSGVDDLTEYGHPGSDNLLSAPVLILQPQSDLPLVRGCLEEMRYVIVDEDAVYEDEKYYFVIKAVPESRAAVYPQAVCSPLSRAELSYGPVLLKRRHPVLQAYLRRQQRTLAQITESLDRADSPSAQIRKKEIIKEMQILEAALAYDEM